MCVGTKLFINNSWKGPRSPDLERKTAKLPIKSGNAFHFDVNNQHQKFKTSKSTHVFLSSKWSRRRHLSKFQCTTVTGYYTKVNFFLNDGSTKDVFFHVGKKGPCCLARLEKLPGPHNTLYSNYGKKAALLCSAIATTTRALTKLTSSQTVAEQTAKCSTSTALAARPPTPCTPSTPSTTP